MKRHFQNRLIKSVQTTNISLSCPWRERLRQFLSKWLSSFSSLLLLSHGDTRRDSKWRLLCLLNRCYRATLYSIFYYKSSNKLVGFSIFLFSSLFLYQLSGESFRSPVHHQPKTKHWPSIHWNVIMLEQFAPSSIYWIKFINFPFRN